MSSIKVMNEILANKINAGEVVEKCVSIVKELVENSIDAGSDDIKIYLKESGLKEIKVIDNGIGMDKEDAILAFQRHATSKLLKEDDLFNINTLGFRGEALPSIAVISEVVLKTTKDNVSTLIHIKGGKLLENTSCEARSGTTITVSNIFYNTPARLKYLKSPYSELANIVDYINKITLSYPNIKFKLVNDDKELLNTDGSSNLLKVIKEIFGLDVAKRMIYIKDENEDYEIDGYISLPEVTRRTKNNMITLVNGRVIKNYELNNTINEAYHTFKEDSRYPIVVLNIKADPVLLDVNIHPTKLDVKFSNFENLTELITQSITSALKTKLLIPKIEAKEKISVPTYEEIKLDFNNTIEEEQQEYKKNLENYINGNDILKKEIAEETVVEEIKNNEKLEELYPIGIALGTYIICENDKGIYLIDQHAAKERINYEKYKYILTHPKQDSISLLIPIILEYPLNEYIIIKENIDFIRNLNIEIEDFGSNSFRITAHPTWLPSGFEEEAIKKILDLIINKEKDFSIEKFNDRLAMTVSCKMSKKANTYSSISEMENLIKDLKKCNNPYHCPHGRPTIIHYSIYELEKLFKRSI